jgi:hypothetical protein
MLYIYVQHNSTHMDGIQLVWYGKNRLEIYQAASVLSKLLSFIFQVIISVPYL